MQIVYFPYLNMQQKDEYLFNDGHIKIWNFKVKGKDYIKDSELYKKVQALVCANTQGGRPIEDVGILTIGNCDFREFTKTEMDTADELKYLLFAVHLSNNAKVGQGINAGHYMYTSENFDLVIQNFKMDNNFFGVQDGFIVRMSVGGYEIGKKKFENPVYLLKPMRVSLDNDLLNELFKLKSKKPTLYNRILEAIKIFFLSYYNTPSLSQNARILLQVSAFEVLLKIPNEKQRAHFRESLDKLCLSKKEKQISYWSEGYGKTKNKRRGTLKAYWADGVYTLRNHIIHGNKVKPKEYLFRNKQNYFDAGHLFFILAIKRLINIASNKDIFYAEVNWEKKNDDYEKFEGFIYDDNNLQLILEKELAKFGMLSV